MGPALGYITASLLLAKWLYLDDEPPVNEKDPRWVGCWYPGLLIAGGVVFIISALLISFPEHLVDHKKEEAAAKRREKKEAKKKGRANNNNNKLKGDEIKNSNMPKLETIEEEIERNFEFLDSEPSVSGASSASNKNEDSESNSPSIFTGKVF